MLQDLYWIQNITDNWDNTDNWSYSSGGASAGITPDTTHRVIFDQNGNGSCLIDTTVNIGAILLSSDYSSSLIQVSYPVYVANDASFLGGAFVGSSADMSVQGSTYIETSFTATDKTTTVQENFEYREVFDPAYMKIYTEEINLTSADATNKFVTLSNQPYNSSNIALNIINGVSQEYGIDYYVEGARIKWDGMRLDGDLSANDWLRIVYSSKIEGDFDHNYGKFDLGVTDNTFSGGGIHLWDLEISGDNTSNYVFMDSSAFVENSTFLTNVFFKGTDGTLRAWGDVTCTSTFGRRNEGLGTELLLDSTRNQNFIYNQSIIPNFGINKTLDSTAICKGTGPIIIEGDFNVYYGVFDTNGLNVEVGQV